MSTYELQNLLRDLLEIQMDSASDDEHAADINNLATFHDAGVMTNDAGLVVVMDDGSQFQVTIVRSK